MELESGDLFERTVAWWLRIRLPSYEKTWGSFVGNDGSNSLLSIEGLAAKKELDRERFSQAHYSFALTAYRIDQLADCADKHFPPAPNFEQFMAGHEQLFLFLAYVGHVRDMFVQMENALHVSSALSTPFQDFYAQRSHVIHGPQMPTAIDDLSWIIPAIAGSNETATEWHKNAFWRAFSFKDGLYAPDFIRKARDELFLLICDIHPKVFDAADKYFEHRRVSVAIHDSIPRLGQTITDGSTVTRIYPRPSGDRSI